MEPSPSHFAGGAIIVDDLEHDDRASFHLRLQWVISRAFWHPQLVLERILETLPSRSRRSRWPRQLVDRLFAGLGRYPVPTMAAVREFLECDDVVLRILRRLKQTPRIDWLPNEERFLPHPDLAQLNVHRLTSRNDLARSLRVPPSALAGFCDVKRHDASVETRHLHYHCRWLAKRYGAYRLIEAPKERLKEVQRRILTQILEHVPAHPAAVGFVKDRSLRDAVAMHVSRDVLLRIDVKDFFPSTGIGKVRRLFRYLGYPNEVASDLARLCTHATPRAVLDALPESHVMERKRLMTPYQLPHLPQGAPTSPALSNLLAYRLDARLTGLAARFGASYSRYADDLMFSGDRRFARSLARFQVLVLATLIDEGYRIRRRKTRIMRRGRRQTSLGLTLNDKVNTSRGEYEVLKALLFNCVRYGPSSQNREGHAQFRSHLLGRIAFHQQFSPRRGEILRGLFDRIEWWISPTDEECP